MKYFFLDQKKKVHLAHKFCKMTPTKTVLASGWHD